MATRVRQEASNLMWTVPKLMTSPSRRSRSPSMRTPLSLTPLVEPRSAMT